MSSWDNRVKIRPRDSTEQRVHLTDEIVFHLLDFSFFRLDSFFQLLDGLHQSVFLFGLGLYNESIRLNFGLFRLEAFLNTTSVVDLRKPFYFTDRDV